MPWESLVAAVAILSLRCVDVSIGTVRVVYAVEGRRRLAAVVGFFEATVFIVAAGIVLSDLTDPIRVLGYGLGYAFGTALGVTLVNTLNLGTVTVRIVVPSGPVGLADALREEGYRLTTFDGEGRDGPVRLIMLVVRKKDLSNVMAIAQPWLKECFVTVGEDPVETSVYPKAIALRK